MKYQRTLVVLAAVASIGGFAACKGDEASTTTANTVTKGTAELTVDEPATTDAAFGAAFHDAYGDTFDEVVAEMGATGDAASSFDGDGAQRHAARVADLFDRMRDGVGDLPGADTDLADTFRATFDTCHDAYAYTADVLDGSTLMEAASNGDLKRATAKITACNDATKEATDATLAAV